MKLEGSTAVVVGGASGLGLATAARLAKFGVKVAVLDFDTIDARARCATAGCHFEHADVTDASLVATALDRAEAVNGKARILVNCAGIGPPQKVIDRDGRPVPIEDFRRIVEVNLIGTVSVATQFAARLIGSEHSDEECGVIVNTASVAAFDGQVGQAAYAASKAGIVGLTLPLARELARHAIRVMTVAPGLFMTPLLASLPGPVLDSLGAQVPFPPRLGDPSEFALMVTQIIENPMLNGETIRLDGAIRMAAK